MSDGQKENGVGENKLSVSSAACLSVVGSFW
jgi:hypothetical protein